jgi:hypothetical protein
VFVPFLLRQHHHQEHSIEPTVPLQCSTTNIGTHNNNKKQTQQPPQHPLPVLRDTNEKRLILSCRGGFGWAVLSFAFAFGLGVFTSRSERAREISTGGTAGVFFISTKKQKRWRVNLVGSKRRGRQSLSGE